MFAPSLALLGTFHVGGIPTKAEFLSPAQLGEVADASYAVTWRDNEQDMTGLFNFFYQPTNVRPGAFPSSPDFEGTLIVGDVPILDPANTHAWDTSAVPAGSYFLYEVTEDAPLAPIVSVGPIPVTIRHAGDARFPATMVTKPDGIGDSQGRRFPVRWRASGEGTLSATIRAQDKDAQTPFETLATGVPMTAGADGLYDSCWEWTLSLVPLSNYTIQVEVTDEGGRTHAAYGSFPVVVSRDASNPETGDPPSCDPAGATDGGGVRRPDGGPGTDGGGGGCGIARGRGAASSSGRGLLGGLAILIVFATTGRQRTYAKLTRLRHR